MKREIEFGSTKIDPKTGEIYEDNWTQVFDTDEEYFDSIFAESMPEVCANCGGPYPNCQPSCKIFDE